MSQAIVKNGEDAGITPEGQQFDNVVRQAKAFAASTIVPAIYQNNLPNCIIAIDTANRIGASSLAVMQNLYVVGGKPSFQATFVIATVNTCGRFTPIRYKFSGKRGEKTWGCRAVAQDKESGEICEGPMVDIAMAMAEGWYDKKGSKWQTMPELMLCYRSAAFWQRMYAPELSLGMRTTEEEQDVQAIVVSRRDIENDTKSELDRVIEKAKAQAKQEEEQPPEREPGDETEEKQPFDVYTAMNEKGEQIFGKRMWPKKRAEYAEKMGIGAKMSEQEASALLDRLIEEQP